MEASPTEGLLNTYQTLAYRTLNKEEDQFGQTMTCLLGLGEVGEVMDHFKKFYYHGHDIDMDAVIKELGDVLWYVAVLAKIYGIPLHTIADRNITKLMKRYPEGFSSERSINRENEA